MHRALVATALAVALFCLYVPPSLAQHIIDPAVVMAPTLFDPAPAPGATFATPTAFVPDGSVNLPWGDWLDELLNAFLVAAGTLALFVLRKLPGAAVSAIDMVAGAFGQGRANELLEKAITYGINTTAGAVKGKTLTVKVGNEVLERAFEYAVRHAPGLIEQLGGLMQIREKIIARLDLEPDASLPSPKPPGETLVSSSPPAPAPATP